MARTFYMSDGTIEVMVENDPENFLEMLIRERMGEDCAELFDEILSVNMIMESDLEDYKDLAENYRILIGDIFTKLSNIMKEYPVTTTRIKSLQKFIQERL